MRPSQSYIIWFSQRVGSTLLADVLSATGIAGKPQELFNEYTTFDLMGLFGVSEPVELREAIWRSGMTTNGVFGLKVSFSDTPQHKGDQATAVFSWRAARCDTSSARLATRIPELQTHCHDAQKPGATCRVLVEGDAVWRVASWQ